MLDENLEIHYTQHSFYKSVERVALYLKQLVTDTAPILVVGNLDDLLYNNIKTTNRYSLDDLITIVNELLFQFGLVIEHSNHECSYYLKHMSVTSNVQSSILYLPKDIPT